MINAIFVHLARIGRNGNDLICKTEVVDQLEGVAKEIRRQQKECCVMTAWPPFLGVKYVRIDATALQGKGARQAGQSPSNDGYALHVLALALARILSRKKCVMTLSTKDGA